MTKLYICFSILYTFSPKNLYFISYLTLFTYDPKCVIISIQNIIMSLENNNLFQYLGFDKAEILVFKALNRQQRISELATNTSLPRMSVHKIIKRFLKRNLIEKSIIGKQKYYSISNNFVNSFKNIPLNEYEKVIVHKGRQELFSLWDRFSRAKGERIFGYQPNFVLKHSLEKIDLDELNKLNHRIKENKVIVESYVETGYIENVRKILGEKKFPTWIRGFRRNAIVYEVPKNIFTSQYEMIIVRDSVFIADWQKEVAIEIRQQEMINILRQFFNLLSYSSTRVDFYGKYSHI